LQYYLGAIDVYNNYDTGPPHEHTNPDEIPDKDCRIWKRGWFATVEMRIVIGNFGNVY
jgi:hypothetical protein